MKKQLKRGVTKIECLCKTPKPRLFISGDINIVKCKNCQLVFADTEIDTKSINRMYNAGPRNIKLSDSPIEFGDCIRRLNVIENIVRPHEGKRILDFGTGNSRFLYVARDRNWKVFGTDINKRVVDLHTKNGIPMLTESELKNNFFDVIVLFHVFEHIPEPQKFLNLLYKKLRKGGVIIIDVPNIDAFTIKLLKEQSPYIDTKVGGHLFYYSMHTLSEMLKRSNFFIIRKEYKGISGIAQIANVKEKISGTRNVSNMYLYLKPFAKLYKKICEILRLSDCIQIIAVKK